MAKRSLAKISTADLHTELKRRSRQLKTLERKRDRIAKQLDEIEAQIEEEGGVLDALSGGKRGGGRKGGGKRPRNEMNLEESLTKVLRNKTLSVTEAAEQVQKAGYKTSSDNFRTIVNQTLINGAPFKRVSRGKYTVKANYK